MVGHVSKLGPAAVFCCSLLFLPSHLQAHISTTPSEGGTTATMSLDALSDELLLLVIKSLPLEVEAATYEWISNTSCPNLKWVVNLSRTSRRLRLLVQEHLYETYDNRVYTPYLFLRSIMSNANAAESVRSMKIDYIVCPSPIYDESTGWKDWEIKEAIEKNLPSLYQPSLSDCEEIEAGMKALQIPDWKEWANRCNHETKNQEPLSAVILMHTPNVQHLEIKHGRVPWDEPKWLDVISHVAGAGTLGRVHILSQLKSIRIHTGVSHTDRIALKTLSPLFRLPSLTRLALVGLREPKGVAHGEPSFRWSVPLGSSSIEELLLYDCYIDAHSLAAMTATCRSLKTLRYDHINKSHDPQHYLHYGLVSQALQPHRHSLRHLALQYSEIHDAGSTKDGIIGKLGSLKSFQKLEYLECSIRAFAWVLGPHTNLEDNLPSSLSTFVFTQRDFDSEEDCMRMCEHTAAHCRTYLPLLENFRVEKRFDTLRNSQPSLYWVNIWKAFIDNGVRFGVYQWTSLRDKSWDE
jgi:hypothetical protein